ncbi:MAG: PilZ domain-containing protein [Halothiobacillaceae bacterium]|nr:PilZ domain-containing protein [Halothiobacillaceae bacterium]
MSRENERRFHRIHFLGQARISWAEQSFETAVIDVSLKGVMLRRPEGCDPHIDDEMGVSLSLNGGESSSAHIDMHTVVRHVSPGGVGCEWVNIDLDSLTALRRLLELNIGDADLLDRELGQLEHL